MNTLTIVPNVFETDDKKIVHEFECSICEFLVKQFACFPFGANLYHSAIDIDRNVTPRDENGIQYLESLSGDFYLVMNPGFNPLTILVIALITAAAVTLLAPKVPDIPAARNIPQGSPNNELSSRSNRPRINGRIPDIYGTQVSTPDLIAQPYTVYDSEHREIEYMYACVGRGYFDINADDVKDNSTRISEIDGASVEVFEPGTSPNSGAPQLMIGDPITEPVLFTQRIESVNGQALVAPNNEFISGGTDNIQFVAPDKIQWVSGAAMDFTDTFTAGDTIIVTTSSHQYWMDSGPPDWYPVMHEINLSGTYLIGSVTAHEIVLSNSIAVNPDWQELDDSYYVANTYGPTGGNLEKAAGSANWVGPYIVDMPTMENFISNFVSPQGMFKDNGTTQTATSVEVQLGLTPVNAAGVATGPETFFNATVEGSATLRTQRAKTLRAGANFTKSRYSVRARRLTLRDNAFSGQVVDEVRWKDFYGVQSVTQTDFGNVTTVQSKTVGTTGALSVKERRLNLLVKRKIHSVTATPTTYTLSIVPEFTDRFSNILIDICRDEKLGNCSDNEINYYRIVETANAVETYFGTTIACQFNYTFDRDNISFEEMVQAVARVAFCEPYRSGNNITMFFEKANTTTRLAFNHVNKIPASEKRSYSFGTDGKYDGIEFEYIDPVDQVPVTYYVPEDRSAVNPQRVQSVGIRNRLQARFHAYRLFNKMKYKRVATQFTALQEAKMLIRNDRILVADNTRQDTQDGEITGKTGLVVTTSQPVELTIGIDYTLFIQLTDGSVESIAVTAGPDEYSLTLASEPSLSLSVSPENYARATYVLVGENESRVLAFLVDERSGGNRFTTDIKAVNYDARYYERDLDFDSGIVDSNGDPLIENGRHFQGSTVTINSNGTVVGNVSSYTKWAVSAPVAGIGASFFMRLVKTTGSSGVNFSVSGGGAGPWRRMDVNRVISASGGAGYVTGNMYIASDENGYNILGTNQVTVSNAT